MLGQLNQQIRAFAVAKMPNFVDFENSTFFALKNTFLCVCVEK